MTGNSEHDQPLLKQGPAPEHRPNFWADLDASMVVDTLDGDDLGLQTTEMAPVPATQPAIAGTNTRQMERVAAASASPAPTNDSPAPSRRVWPLAAAAALLAVVGIGAFVLAGPDDAATTEVVAGTTDADSAPLDGPEGESVDGDENDSTANDQAAADQGGGDQVDADERDTGQGAGDTSATTGGDDAQAPGAADEPAQSAAPAIPDFASAVGATGEPDHVPLDQGIPADGTFLANWPAAGVTWYAVTDSATGCDSAGHTEIRYVNGSGITQSVRDPQLRFSGEISHFSIRSQQSLAAWVVSCGMQLELYTATLEPNGQVGDLTLAWLGEGAISSGLVLWEQNEVSLNAIDPEGRAFNIDYNVQTGLLSRNGGPSRIMLEVGAPAERSLTPLAATPDGGLTYWAGKAPAGTVSACSELYGSGVSDTLWLRQGEGQWQLAVADDVPLATVTAVALEPEFTQIAFADVCAGETGRVFVGTQRADGRVSNLREIDLTPFVPGFAAQLHWVDAETLRIETDNSGFGFGTVRFDYRFDDGAQNGVIVQLD